MSAKLYRRRRTDQKTPVLDKAPEIPMGLTAEIKQAVDRCIGIMGTLDQGDNQKAVDEFERKVEQDEVLNKRGRK